MIPAAILLAILVRVSEGIVGYDCGSQILNITTLSLINVGDCDIPETRLNITDRYVQLLQINEFREAPVVQCKIEIHRTVYKCGMFSHISLVNNGEADYIQEISAQACRNAHLTGSLMLGYNHIVNGLRVNRTITHSITLAGNTDSDGKCSGERYSDPYGNWDSVVVQGTAKITLTSFIARVSINDNLIHLQSGTVCSLSENACIDSEGGYSFWKSIPGNTCKFDSYGILYEGHANKMINNDHDGLHTIYSLESNAVTFALTARGRENVCGYTIIKTEHPKLVIFETIKGETFALNTKVSVNNLDMFTYINSKFVYVERHIRTQMQELYKDVITQKCNAERQTLKNALTIATQAPDEFAFNIMKGPGYMAVIAGEVTHIVKCIPVEVKIEHGEQCYAELKVSRNNRTYFLTPRTHILKEHGTVVPCNSFLPSLYFVENSWYKVLPKLVESLPPQHLKPMTQLTWKYIKPTELATSGIYTDKELNELRERIMFPVEHAAIINDIAREITGYPVNANGGTLMKLLNEDAVTKLAESTWNKMWGGFLKFGTASAGVIGIFMLYQTIKMVIDILIRGYTLHAVFGWSFRLIAALWGTITNHLIAKESDKPNMPGRECMPQTSEEENLQLQTIESKPVPNPRETASTSSSTGSTEAQVRFSFT